MGRFVTALVAAALSMALAMSSAASKGATGPRAAIGNTIHEVDVVDGEAWDYYKPDGSGVSLSAQGERESFAWTIKGDVLCRTYATPPSECSKFEVNGNSGVETFVSGTDTGQERTPFELIAGNPKGL
jgi:hypothetical protein